MTQRRVGRGEEPVAERRTLSRSSFRALISKGREQGYLTCAEVNDLLPESFTDPDQLEDVVQTIINMGIEVLETKPEANRATDSVRKRGMGVADLLTGIDDNKTAKRGLSPAKFDLRSFCPSAYEDDEDFSDVESFLAKKPHLINVLRDLLMFLEKKYGVVDSRIEYVTDNSHCYDVLRIIPAFPTKDKKVLRKISQEVLRKFPCKPCAMLTVQADGENIGESFGCLPLPIAFVLF